MDEHILASVAELFGLFGDKTRVRILYELLQEELCVGDIAQRLGKDAKAVDNAVQRIRRKMAQDPNFGDISAS